MYKVSVIMPIYNNENTLRQAIESIINQSVFDFELILIDDGSTDSSAQICMEYARREPLIIRFIPQERLGHAKMLNKGLHQAKGKYIYFADAQNRCAPRMLEVNLELAEEKNAELVVFGFIEVNEAIEQIPRLPFLLSKERFRNHYRNFHNFYPYELCNKLYEVQYLRQKKIKFHDLPLTGKGFFNVDVYQDLNKVVFNRNVYCRKPTYDNEESLKYQENHWEVHLKLIHHLKAMFADWELTEEYEDLIIREYYELLKAEVLNLSSPDLNLSTRELEKAISRLLAERCIVDVMNKEKGLFTKNLFERALWNSFRKRNTRVIIKLIQRKKRTTKLTRKVKGKFKKWFND